MSDLGDLISALRSAGCEVALYVGMRVALIPTDELSNWAAHKAAPLVFADEPRTALFLQAEHIARTFVN